MENEGASPVAWSEEKFCSDIHSNPRSQLGENLSMTNALVKMEAECLILKDAYRLIAQCHTVPEVTRLVDMTRAYQACVKKARLGRESENEAAACSLKAMSRAGEILSQIPRKQGLSGLNSQGELSYTQILKNTKTRPAVAHKWQKLGNIPEEMRRDYVESVQNTDKGEITVSGFLGSKPVREFFRAQKKEKYNITIAQTKPKNLEPPYRILYADPPWKYIGLNQADEYGHAERHYDCLDDKQLKKYKVGGKRLVRDMMDKNAVLFLWVTSPLLKRCFAIIEAWGFEYQSSFIWYKIKHNMGHYNSVRHELLLIATRGSCKPDVPKLVNSVQSIERTKHSEKPEEFRKIIEELYDHGRKLELFRRGAAPAGWDTEGNEAE